MLLLASLMVAMPGCNKKQNATVAASETSNPNEISITPALARNLNFGEPEITNVTGTLRVSAHIETDARRIARVGSPVAGRILKLLVFEGEYVKAGTVLAMLHSTRPVGHSGRTDQGVFRSRAGRRCQEACRTTGCGGCDWACGTRAPRGRVAAGHHRGRVLPHTVTWPGDDGSADSTTWKAAASSAPITPSRRPRAERY